MNKELIEMMGKMMEQMNEMQSEMKNGFSAVNERIDGLDSKVDTGFNSMKEMLYGIGNQFELRTETNKYVLTPVNPPPRTAIKVPIITHAVPRRLDKYTPAISKANPTKNSIILNLIVSVLPIFIISR